MHELPPLKPRRTVRGISAILLPFAGDGSVDWPAFEAHVERTAAAGLTPAVNMDTGYVHLLGEPQKTEVLDRTRGVLGGDGFVAGAFVKDAPGDAFDRDAYAAAMAAIVERGGTPVVFQSFGLVEQGAAEVVRSYERLGELCDRFLGFELTPDLAPFGRIYDLDTYRGMMGVNACVGAKHSSFKRGPEWERLKLRDAVRPDFTVYTGNDFAIDMIRWGSDYLLGLSTFAPDKFAERDALWAAGDPAFYELNDELQYLGRFAFRTPGPAYKHSAAQFLKLRGWAATDRTHPGSPERPPGDAAVLGECAERLGVVGS